MSAKKLDSQLGLLTVKEEVDPSNESIILGIPNENVRKAIKDI